MKEMFEEFDAEDWIFFIVAPIAFGIAWGTSHVYFMKIFSEIVK